MNYYFLAFQKYADFYGKANREEYWLFVLFTNLATILTIVLDHTLDLVIHGTFYGPIYLIYLTITFIPGLSLAVRRLHDVGKSGWMLLLAFIPIIGALWLLYLFVSPGIQNHTEQKVNTEYGEPLDADLNFHQSKGLPTNTATGDTILLVSIGWMFFSRLFWGIIPKVNIEFYRSAYFEWINIVFLIIGSIMLIAMSAAIYDKNKKTIVLVMGILYSAYGMYEIYIYYLGKI
jgi:uncharacterized membrane protein YhaH (DUF805 family)